MFNFKKKLLKYIMKVYLGDLFHTWTKGGIWTIPLNVGYVGSYLKENGGSRLDTKNKII